MEVHDLLTGVAVLIGLAGIVLVFLPGLLLQVAAVLLWAMTVSDPVGWVVFGLVLALAMAATILKYAFPRRHLTAAGVPGWLIFLALIGAVVGLFAIPLVGAPIGFVVVIYLFERVRRGPVQAWPSTKTAVRAVLTSTGIELAGGLLILFVFVAGAFLT